MAQGLPMAAIPNAAMDLVPAAAIV